MCDDISVASTRTILGLQVRDVAQCVIVASMVPPQEVASRGKGQVSAPFPRSMTSTKEIVHDWTG
jgi:hypothetical protein